jgi:hypothetical protein
MLCRNGPFEHAMKRVHKMPSCIWLAPVDALLDRAAGYARKRLAARRL